MCNSLQHPRKMQMALWGAAAPRLRNSTVKLILSENVVKPSIYTALLSIFPSQSEKNVGVKYVYQKYQVRNEKKKKALKWRFQSFVQPGNSF